MTSVENLEITEDVRHDVRQPGWQLLVGSALLATAGWRHPFLRGIAVAVGGAGIYLVGRRWYEGRLGNSQQQDAQDETAGAGYDADYGDDLYARPESRDEVDRASQESFPASDPPSFTPGGRGGSLGYEGTQARPEGVQTRIDPLRPLAPDVGTPRTSENREANPPAPDLNLDDWTRS